MSKKKQQKKLKSRSHETAIKNFSEVFKAFSNMVIQDQTACNHNHNENLRLNKNNRFNSIICPIYNRIQTQQRCLFEVAGGFVYNGKHICGRAFCASYGASWDVNIDLGDVKCIFENSYN